MASIEFMEKKAAQIRMDLLNMIYKGKAGHTGGSLSCTDILTTLYYSVMKMDPANPEWEERDRFILSKGHSVEGYYCILADKGFFPKEDLETFSKFGSKLIGHPNNTMPGVEVNTGALGHGLSVGVGMALANKLDNKTSRVFVLMGDGEQAEGSIWEAAMAAGHFKLDNLIGIIDRNRLQISGRTANVMALEPLADKWQSFGWEVTEVDGHNFQQLEKILNSVPVKTGKPTLVIANTIKGKGVSFMENNPVWHHGVPDKDEIKKALEELSSRLEADSNE